MKEATNGNTCSIECTIRLSREHFPSTNHYCTAIIFPKAATARSPDAFFPRVKKVLLQKIAWRLTGGDRRLEGLGWVESVREAPLCTEICKHFTL